MTVVSITTPFRVVIVGCSYAGLAAAANLTDLSRGLTPRQAQEPYKHHPQHRRVPIDITIVDKRDGFFHLIGSPLALASATYSPKAWIRACDIPALQSPNVRFLHGSASSLDASSRRLTVTPSSGGANGKPSVIVEYDFLVAASGLDRPWPVVPQALTRSAYLAEAGEHIRHVARPESVVLIVGGGAVGIEMAAELKLVHPDVRVVLAHSRDRLMSSEGLSDDCKGRALELLLKGGVEVLLSHRVGNTHEVDRNGETWTEVEFSTGEKMVASQVVWAVSRPKPTSSYLPAGALDPEGYVKIQPSLRFSPGTPNSMSHYCAGDLVRWSGIKRCGAAMHMGYYTAVNIHQTMLSRLDPTYGPELLEMQEVPPMIALAVGKSALACGPDGISFGEDIMKSFFGDDLGFTIVWNHLGLGKPANE